jgi:homoserine dehydrogenase
MDVARKVVILARECGMQIELEDVTVQSLVPEPLQSTSSVLDFMDRLPQVH